MLSRKKTRELLMQYLYQIAILGIDTETTRKDFLKLYEEDYPEELPDKAYFDKVLAAVSENKEGIDLTIESSSDNWKLHRISKVDLAILRLGTAEILFTEDVPDKVAANEAVELAKRFGSDHSPKFINGILGKVIKGKEKV